MSSWGDCPPTPPPVRGDCEQVMRGDRWGDKKFVGGEFGLKKSNICKIHFVCSTHTFHKNICFTVCLNSAEFCDSAMVNIGC